MKAIASSPVVAYDRAVHQLPLAESQQRRVWWAGSRWWAILPDSSSAGWALYAAGDPGGAWTPQGVIDDRRRVRIDVASAGDDLLIAAAGTGGAQDALRVSRYVLEGGRYRLLPDAPLEVQPTGVRALSAALGVGGEAWLAYVAGDRLIVQHAKDGESPWEPGPAFAGAAGGSSPTALSLTFTTTGVALAWTTAGADRLWIERIAPAGWTEAEVRLGGQADGTLGAVSVPANDGDLLLLVGVRPLGGGQSPAIVMVRDRVGVPPTVSLVARVADRLRTPVLSLAPKSSAVVVMASVPTSAGGSIIVAKTAPIDTLAFATGPGDVALSAREGGTVRDPMVPAAASPGGALIVIAADTDAAALRSGLIGVGPGAVAARPGGLAPAADVALVRQSFDVQTAGATPAGWTRPGASASGSFKIVEDAGVGRFARLTSAPGDAARACLHLPAVANGELVLSASVRLGNLGVGDAWLALRGTSDAAVIRFDDNRTIAYRIGTTKTWTGASFVSARWYQWEVRVDVTTGRYGWTLKSASGATIAAVADVPWSMPAPGPVDLLCAEVPAGRGTPRLDIDNVEILQVLPTSTP